MTNLAASYQPILENQQSLPLLQEKVMARLPIEIPASSMYKFPPNFSKRRRGHQGLQHRGPHRKYYKIYIRIDAN